MLRLGLLGLGAINTALVKLISYRGNTELKAVRGFDISSDAVNRFRELVSSLGIEFKFSDVPDELWEDGVDCVVEAASFEALRNYAPRIIGAGKYLLPLSVGAFLVYPELKELYNLNRDKILIPGGALGSSALFRLIQTLNVRQLKLRTIKPPEALGLKDIKEDTLVFDGEAHEAVKRYPRNLNVSAVLSLITGLPVHVSLIASPKISRNTHIVEVDSTEVHLVLKLENIPSPDNPRTSALTVYSVYYELQQLSQLMKRKP